MTGSVPSYFCSAVIHAALISGLFIWSGPLRERFEIEGKQRTASIEVTAAYVETMPPVEPAFEVPSPAVQSVEEPEPTLPESVVANQPPPEISISLPELAKPSEPETEPLASESHPSVDNNQVTADLSGNPPPPYPAEAIRHRLEGVVMLKLFVNALGNVVFVEVVSSSGHRILDEAASQALLKWKGKPATRFGVSIPSEEFLPIRFRL